jgi:predicted nucleic acid-binding protein
VILADTSAWVEYDRATGSATDLRLTELIEQDGPVVVTEPVAMEVLGGAGNEQRYVQLYRLLHAFDWLPYESQTDFDGAARIYRQCRTRGVTPRGFIDCMIAQVALRTGATLLARDVDLERVARVVGIELDIAEPR